jgi:hypothetical protein
MKWITRQDVKVDRVACPWLIKRFIDPQAEFLFVEEKELVDRAKQEGDIPLRILCVHRIRYRDKDFASGGLRIQDLTVGDPLRSSLITLAGRVIDAMLLRDVGPHTHLSNIRTCLRRERLKESAGVQSRGWH